MNHSGSGSKLIQEFIFKLTNEIERTLKKYQKATADIFGDEDVERPHHIYEQVTKGFITVALNKVTGTNFLQELPVKRKINDKVKNGKVDYFARYKSIRVLIEVKQSRVSVQQGKLKIGDKLKKSFKNAIIQIDNISKRTSIEDGVWYGVAICIVPFYVADKLNKKGYKVTDVELQRIKNELSANEIGYIAETRKYVVSQAVTDSKGKYKFPGMFVILKTKKITKEKVP